jgi:hypothetical protein
MTEYDNPQPATTYEEAMALLDLSWWTEAHANAWDNTPEELRAQARMAYRLTGGQEIDPWL